MANRYEQNIRPGKIGRDAVGALKGAFTLPQIGPGEFFLEEERSLSNIDATIETPFGPIKIGGLAIDTKDLDVVTPTVSLDVTHQFPDIDSLRCTISINGQEFTSEPTRGDEFPDKTTIFFYNWKKPGEVEEVEVLLPKDLEKLQEIGIKIWAE